MRHATKDRDPLSIEVPKPLKARLAQAAKEARRSLTAEAVLRLERSFDRPAHEA